MARHVFFVSWQLWQQMTFVLAVCIVLVFFLGLAKLWKNNRLLAKQEMLDVEKRARMSEVRKTGVSLRKGADIPFGVRAIQGGVEVDGIWISHPTTPASKPNLEAPSVTTLIDVDGTDQHGKRKMLDTDSVDSRPRHSQSDNRYTDVESLDSNRSSTPRQSHLTAPRPRQSRSTNAMNNALNEDTLRRLNGHGHSQGRPVYQTYMPTRQPRRSSQRSTASSSSGDSVSSQPRSGTSARSGSGGSYASTRSYRARSSPRDRPAGYDTPTGRTRVSPLVAQQSPSFVGQAIPMPEPTFGPGDVHLNRNARRVNQGFEVLPAGTFGVSPELGTTGDAEDMGEMPTKRPRPPVQQDSSRNF